MHHDITRTNCVFDALDNQIIVWHVDTGPEYGLSRMAGAWVLDATDERVTLLVSDRRVVASPAGEDALVKLGIKTSCLIEPAATVANLIAERDVLQTSYERHPRMAKLVSPNWPTIPVAADLQDPPLADAPHRTRRALGLARWLESIAQAWDRMERERMMRSYMPGGLSRRSFPLATRANAQ